VSPTRPVWRQRAARVVRQEAIAAGHFRLEVEVPLPFAAARPGQFLQLCLPAPGPVLLPRPMSVAGVSRVRGAMRLEFLYAAVGTGTRALAELGPGAQVSVLGPLGRGFPLAHPGTPVLVAGGRGVGPLLFAADVLARARRSAVLLFGARSRERLVGLAEAHRRLGRPRARTRVSGSGYPGVQLHVCTDDGSLGPRGDVVRLLERVVPGLDAPLVLHACGPHAMLGALARWALARGVPAFVAMESTMACGTGVCRGCALPRSAAARAGIHASDPRLAWAPRCPDLAAPSLHGNREWAMCCTEGPVFAVGDLDWERIP
jgi:dihydroorotate dehydrogenase electron transfer subunit